MIIINNDKEGIVINTDNIRLKNSRKKLFFNFLWEHSRNK